MSVRSRKIPLAALAVAAVLLMGACSDNSHTKVTTGTYAGESGQNAPYLDVGPLIYEVQLSRQLNPTNSEDMSYLRGLTPAQRQLAPGQEWFAVFMQVYNTSARAHPSASDMTISDTQGNVYAATIPDATNEYAYRPRLVPASDLIPPVDTTASFGPTQGSMLLYRIQTVSLDNRPLELKIVDPTNSAQTASAELDV